MCPRRTPSRRNGKEINRKELEREGGWALGALLQESKGMQGTS